MLEEWGFDVDVTEVSGGRWNTVASLSGNAPGPTLMLNGHLDTVGVEGMTVDPFAGAIEDGRLWGRGACDMKGGVASLLSAAASISRDREWPGRLIVALTSDEEHASLGMQAVASSVAGVDAAIVCEPTDLAVMPAHKGFVWVELDFTGRAAHGSRPDVGVDAIEHAGMVLARFGELRERLRAAPPHLLLGHGSVPSTRERFRGDRPPRSTPPRAASSSNGGRFRARPRMRSCPRSSSSSPECAPRCRSSTCR